MDFIMFWRISRPNGTSVTGQYVLPELNLGPMQSILPETVQNKIGRVLYAQTEREKTALLNSLIRNRYIKDENPIMVYIEVDDNYFHDFKNDSPLVSTIRFKMVNQSSSRNANYILELQPSEEVQNMQVFKRSFWNISDFHWIGQTVFKGHLMAGAETIIQSLACFLRQSVYDIGRWRLTCESEGKKFIMEHKEILISVHDKS